MIAAQRIGKKMIWKKVGKHLGLISSKKYNEFVLMKKIEKSGLFNPRYYLATNPDVRAAKMNPVKHYLKYGWAEGRNPSPLFDNDAYLRDWPDVAAARMCPLAHYIEYGRNVRKLLHVNFIDVAPVYKVLKKSKFFDKKWYLNTYPDVRAAGVNPIKHYILHGASEGRNPSKHFNTSYYLKSNPDVKTAGMNPLYHWIKYGATEGRIAKALDGQNTCYGRTFKQQLKYACSYPERVYEEYHRLKDEINKIKNSK